MPTLDPVPLALVPVDSAAADAIGAPNYDEFQSDEEVWEILQQHPKSVLRITMPQCDVPSRDGILDEHAAATLAKAGANLAALRVDPLTRTVTDMVWVYEITVPSDPSIRQIGLGGMGRTREIRTAANPGGSIIRNEGVRDDKARGRADLTRATGADMGMVNNAVDDVDGDFYSALDLHARNHPVSFETHDETGNRHRVWIVEDAGQSTRLRDILAREPRAYVADGNHRSAAAAMLGNEHFLTVFFPARTMTIAPYNRLVDTGKLARVELRRRLAGPFEVEAAPVVGPWQPWHTHDIGLYDGERWLRLRPRAGTYDPNDAAQDIDADIVQRHLFDLVLGIADARDERITYVGANRDEAWLQGEVDAGRHDIAVTLAPVTMAQFVKVCLQDKLMPPKSTWFVPKIRTGLVMALLHP
ncbi:MAG: DUF1015 domain-containing protein [Gemmatimonadaceae bacterium]|nr:DUF1015 domain-containing protein [Gemmatimonadaceae bacterium]